MCVYMEGYKRECSSQHRQINSERYPSQPGIVRPQKTTASVKKQSPSGYEINCEFPFQ